MKKLLLLFFFVGCSILQLNAQDTLSIACRDTSVQLIKLRPGNTNLFLKGNLGCDSLYLVSGRRYMTLQHELRDSKNFVQLYKFYRDQVKKGDQDVSSIMDGYELILKTKDNAYNKLMDEYNLLNHLLDTSIAQTGAAVDLSKKSLASLSSSLDTMAATNEHLRTDLKNLQKINRRNKWEYGIGGLIVGILAGIIIAK